MASAIKIDKPKSSSDWQAIRELCCLTGNNGAPIERERWPFFAELWVGPYQALLPEWTYVARRSDSTIAGYLTGCPDTRAFERRRRLCFTPKLVFDLVRGRYEYSEDTRRFLRRLFGLEKSPPDRFPSSVRALVDKNYQAHLHVNVAAGTRGEGIGHSLLEAFWSDLQAQGGRGLHVYCGADPVPFYAREGFTELGRIQVGKTPVFALGRSIRG